MVQGRILELLKGEETHPQPLPLREGSKKTRPQPLPLREGSSYLTKQGNCYHTQYYICYYLFHTYYFILQEKSIYSPPSEGGAGGGLYFVLTHQYTTGNIVTTRMREPIPPAKMVTPTGIQNDDCAMIIGTTPTAVVAVVRKMGTMRRLPAS